jgi:hypothetical protein
MMAFFKTIIGLVIDDLWLAVGIIISTIITYLFIQSGISKFGSGWLLVFLILCTLFISLWRESYKKRLKNV